MPMQDGNEVRHDEGADGGEKWLLQNTANCRSGKFSPSKIVISLSIEIGRLAWAFYGQLSYSYGQRNISYFVSYQDCNCASHRTTLSHPQDTPEHLNQICRFWASV